MLVNSFARVRQAVILAAGERPGFDVPVAFLELEGTTIIERQIEQLRSVGIEHIVIVTGFQAPLFERLLSDSVITVHSERYKWTGTMYSLSLVKDLVDSDFLLVEGDIVFEQRAVDYLLTHPQRTCLLLANESGSGDEALVELQNEAVFKISKDIHQLSRIDGEFIGLSKIALPAFQDMLAYFSQSENPYLNYEYALLSVRNNHVLGYVRVDDLVWAEIDRPEQYQNLVFRVYPRLLRRERELQSQQVLDKALAILGTGYEVVAPVEKLGGMNNNNYKIVTNQGAFVLRLPGKGTETSVDREQEHKNARLAFSLGLDCEIVYFDADSGLKLTKYIEDAETLTIATAKREANMELMAKALRILHTSGRKFERTFDPFRGIAEYEKDVSQQDGLMFEDFGEVKSMLSRLQDELEREGLEYVPCHLDAWPENFVKSGDRIYLIDWEYSGNYDKAWDVVSIGLECEFSTDEEELFLRKYFGSEPSPSERRKMDILRIVMDVYWSLWALAKVAHGDHSLHQYSKDRYERGKANLAKYVAQYYSAVQG